MEDWPYYLAVAVIAYFVGKSSMRPTIAEKDKKFVDLTRTHYGTKTELQELSNLYDETLANLSEDSVLLPSLARWSETLQKAKDDGIANDLRSKKWPAKKAAEEVRSAKREARESKKELNIALNRVDLYESLAPWLTEYTESTVHELLESIREDIKQNEIYEMEDDPVSLYVPKSEWKKMSVAERNQLALDRYCNPSRKRSPWAAGIQYERYVGYIFEKQGFKVEYQGALKGKEDLGIDLICQKVGGSIVAQCKRLSVEKQIPVRENVVAQVYGTARYYQMHNSDSETAIPMIVTSYELSDEAKRFAKYLGVEYQENLALKPYPMIKCNISKRGSEKIYHLPIDQQYDKVVIGDVEGEFYAKTVSEAEKAGFRRAFRWKGDKDST